jgi:sugar transferase (PEP-CTERM/EpsH1 system associated)
MPIRIMHVVDSLGKGGLENGLVNLINRMDPARFEHVVCTLRGLGPNADRLPRDRVRIQCLAKQNDSRFQAALLARAIRQVEPDIVHSRNWAAIEAVFAGRWVRAGAVVHSEHGLDSNAHAKEPWRRVCFRRLAFELAHRVLSVSYQLRDFHARNTGFGAPKITVIHNGVDSRHFFPDPLRRASVRRELGLSEGEFCIGCVGSLFPIKDHRTLLQAIAQAAGEMKNWRLLLAGEGPELPNLQAFVESHPEWSTRVFFLGTADRVADLLNALDVYVLPSVSEGISNSLLEAMASGLATVATAAGGNPEVVVDGQSGLLFPVADARKLAEQLCLLAGRPELRAHLGKGAVRRVREEFSIDSMVRKYEHVYESLAPAMTSPAPAVARV